MVFRSYDICAYVVVVGWVSARFEVAVGGYNKVRHKDSFDRWRRFEVKLTSNEGF